MTLRIVIVLVAVFVAALLVPAPVLGEFPEGREVYVKRCLPCHQRKKIDYDPAAYTQRAMREMVARMSPMSKLGNDEQMAVASYLEAGRTGGVKVPPIVLPATGQPAVSTNEFAVAQELCLTKCASCHAHKPRTHQSREIHRGEIEGMGRANGPNCAIHHGANCLGGTLPRSGSHEERNVARFSGNQVTERPARDDCESRIGF